MVGEFDVDSQGISEVFNAGLQEVLEDDMVEYLVHVALECEEFGDAETLDGLVATLVPFLEGYGAAESSEAAEDLARKLSGELVAKGFIQKKQQGQSKSERTNRKPAMPMQAQSIDDHDDTWGIKTVKHQNKANMTVDSISDAIGDKRSQKKLEKERKKEEARVLKEEQQIQNLLQEDTEPPEPATVDPKRMSQNLRNKSRNVAIDNISIFVGTGKVLLEDAELKIVHGRKYGMIGRNGAGKSTLFSRIANRQFDEFPPYLSVAQVKQEVVADSTAVVEVVLKADTERERLRALERSLLAELDGQGVNGAKANEINENLHKVYDELAAIGAESAEARVRSILGGLGFSKEKQDAPTNSLSGGWRMRVSLAAALFKSPDLLLLDEPTNHLDVGSVLWLEEYLKKYLKTFILVSHDRVFLNNVITDVILLENKKLNYFKGDIDVFEKTRANQRLEQQRAFEAQEAKRNHMQKFVDKFRYNAKRASLVQSRIKALNKMQLVEEVIDDPEFKFSFPEPVSELNKVIEVQEVSFAYAGSEFLFQNVDFSVFTSSRIVLLGNNGCGKSTFAKILLGDLEPTKGYVQRDPKLRICFFAQHHIDQLDVKVSPLDHLLATFPGSKPEQIRPHLARYGIPADLAMQRIGTLSGGQKSRIAFAKITYERPHVLILDEPSNHLDLESVTALIYAISTFEGGIVMISHDQSLIQAVAEEIWVMSDGKMTQFHGSFEDYKREYHPDV